MRSRMIAVGMLTVVSSASWMNVEAQAQNQAEPANRAALTFYSAGLEGVLVDKKDQELLNALKLVDKRVAELPLETGQPIPVSPIQFGWQLLTGPMGLRAGLIEGADPREGPPFFAQMNFFADTDKRAQGYLQRFTGMLNMMARQPVEAVPGQPNLKMMQLDQVPFYFGTTNQPRPALTLALNKPPAGEFDVGRTDLPQGVNPAFHFQLDARELQPLFEMMFAQAPPEEIAPVRMQLELMGLVGENPTTITASWGYAADRALGVARFAKYRQMMTERGMLASSRIKPEDLRRIPADATYAQLSKMNFSAIGQMLQAMAEQAAAQGGDAPPDIMAMAEMHTGIHPQRDILDHLGQTAGIYMSDTTGGGGWLSTTAFIEVKNTEALQATMSKLASMANQLSTTHAKGYVRVSERTVNGQKMTVLAFPGLPVPLELSWAIADGYLYAGLSPGSLLAAIGQAKTGNKGLLDNPRFREMGGEKLNEALQVTFVDTPRMLRDGYGVLNLAMSAIANAVRSPSDPERGVGVILPPLPQLAEGAKASVTVTSLQGDDMVVNAQCDRSWLVNLAGGFGLIGGSTGAIAATAMLTGIMVPALGKARESAKTTKSSVQLRAIAMAMMTYARENDDRMPESLDVLLERDFLTAEILRSPLGPAPDGDDYWINTRAKNDSNSRRVLGYDRAMYANGDNVAVAFFDGHVEILTPWEFEERLDDETNAGTDFNLP